MRTSQFHIVQDVFQGLELFLSQADALGHAAARLIKTVVAPPVGITAEQTASAKQLMDEVIVPKFQALIAGETTAQAMYDEIVKQATAVFGEDGCDLT